MSDIVVIFEPIPTIEVIIEKAPDVVIEFPSSQGASGIPGKSSYDIYVENGGTLSEQDWIDSFVDTYSKTEIEDLLDQNFINYYTKTEIDNKTIDGGNF